MAILKSLARTGLIPAVVGGNIATLVLEKATGKKFGRATTEELAETEAGKVLGLATLGTASALVPLTAAGRVALARAIPRSVVGKTLGALTLGAASVSPTIASAVVSAPAIAVDLGIKAGTKVEKLPEEQKNELEEEGLLSGVGKAAVGGFIGGLAAVPIIKQLPFFKDKEKNGKVEVLTPPPPPPPAAINKLPKPNGKEIEKEAVPSTTPIIPATEDLDTKPRKRRFKKRLEGLQQKITQSVRVNVNQKQSANRITKKYLNVIH